MAAGRVQELQQKLDALQGEQAALLSQIATIVQQAVAASHAQLAAPGGGGSGGGGGGGAGAPGDRVAELTLLSEARGYVALLRDCSDAARRLDRHARQADALAEDPDGLAALAAAGADMYAAALQEADALYAYGRAAHAHSHGGDGPGPAGAVPEALREWEGELARRLQASLSRLRGALSAAVESQLAACGWPPPIAGGGGGGGGGSSAGGAGGGAAAAAFGGGPPEALQRLLLSLTQLQRAEERAGFEAVERSGQPLAALAGPRAPLLWSAELLAAPVGARLSALFANDAPAGRLDRPSWLFATVLRLARDYGPQLSCFQPSIDGAGIGASGQYVSGAEFSRALREAAKQLLRCEKLPALLASDDRELWLSWVDAMIDFESKMAAPLGVLGGAPPPLHPGDAPPLPAALLRGGTLAVMSERGEWMEAWLASEGGSALAALEGVLYSPGAWDPAASLQAEDQPAWRCEFYPPAAAEGLVSLVAGQLLPRVHYLPTDEAQDRYIAFLALEVLGGAQATVVRALQQADLFRDVKNTGSWLTKVCVCVCFCHYLEHHLGDVTLTLTEIFKRRAAAAAAEAAVATGGPGGGGSEPPQQQQDQQQQQNGAPETAAAAAAAAAAKAAAAAAGEARRMLSKPISDFAAARREWSLKIAKGASQGFLLHAAGYMANPAPFKDPDSSAADAAVVSPGLVDALRWLQGVLTALSQQLDRDCFRDCVRATAAAVNRELYNGVATEMIFSPAGARQLAVDADALLRLFQPYCWKSPRAYFPELLDAVTLLTLEDGPALDALRRAVEPEARGGGSGGGGGGGGGAEAALRLAGVRVLDAEQADAVLSLKL